MVVWGADTKKKSKKQERKKTMKKRLFSLIMVLVLTLACATTSLACTPKFTAPKLPTIPNISGSVTLPAGATEAAKKAGAEAVKNLNIDWSKIKFNF